MTPFQLLISPPCGEDTRSPTPPHLSLRLTCDQILSLAPSPRPKKLSLVRWPRVGALALDGGARRLGAGPRCVAAAGCVTVGACALSGPVTPPLLLPASAPSPPCLAVCPSFGPFSSLSVFPLQGHGRLSSGSLRQAETGGPLVCPPTPPPHPNASGPQKTGWRGWSVTVPQWQRSWWGREGGRGRWVGRSAPQFGAAQ